MQSNAERRLQKHSVNNYMNVSFFGIFTCLLTLVLAFMFKEYLINLLTYLEERSTSNILEFHVILLLLYILMSLPVLSPYLICVLISSYVYGFFCSLPLVIIYTVIGMTFSFYICRYMFAEYAHARVKSILYLHAICSLIQSNEKGYKIIFLSRLMPLPFGLANFAFAITDVNFVTYLMSSVIGLLPSQIILCYVGSTLKSMSDVIVNASTAKTAWLVFIIQLIIACFVMLWILNMAKLELNKHIAINETADKTDAQPSSHDTSYNESMHQDGINDLKSKKQLLIEV